MGKRGSIRVGLLSSARLGLGLLGVMFAVGGLIGMICAGCVNGESGAALGDYLNACLSQEGGWQVPVWSAAWRHLRFPLAVCLLSLTAAGVVGIPLVFGIRGFLFTFGVGCFCRLYGWPGVLPALALFGVPALVWAPVLFLLGLQGMGSALSLCRREALPLGGAFWRRWILCGIALWGCVLLEVLAVPRLLAAAARIVL